MKFHQAAVVQYVRLEIVGIVVGAFFVVMTIYNIAMGGFKLSFDGQPVAHFMQLWNILGKSCMK